MDHVTYTTLFLGNRPVCNVPTKTDSSSYLLGRTAWGMFNVAATPSFPIPFSLTVEHDFTLEHDVNQDVYIPLD